MTGYSLPFPTVEVAHISTYHSCCLPAEASSCMDKSCDTSKWVCQHEQKTSLYMTRTVQTPGSAKGFLSCLVDAGCYIRTANMAWQISMHVWRMGPLRASQAALLNNACQILHHAQGLSRMLPAKPGPTLLLLSQNKHFCQKLAGNKGQRFLS